jgi:hypothetical protein
MAIPQAASPRDSPGTHAKKMGFDPDNLTDAQYKQADAQRRAYFAKLNKKSVLARQAQAAARKAGREQAREAGGAA